ncbi:MAG: DUF4386 family protein [Dehalococcoidia bacterium]
MKDLQRVGGMAALVEAATYIVGFAIGLIFLSDYLAGDMSAAETVKYIVDKEGTLYAWYTIIYVVNGIFLVVLAQSLAARFRSEVPSLAQTGAVFGFIWAGLVLASGMITLIGFGTLTDLHAESPTDAALVWESLSTVQDGLGGGIEIVGGLWIVLVSWAAHVTQRLPRFLNYLGVLAGIAGIATIAPPLADAAAVFGLGMIAWFAWAGVVMLRDEAA